MLPLLALALALAVDRPSSRRRGYVEAPLSAWCRCQGETCAKSENFGGFFNGFDWLFASKEVKGMLRMMARDAAKSWASIERRILTKEPEQEVEFIVRAETWPVYAPFADLPLLPGATSVVYAALNTPDHPAVLRSADGKIALVRRVLPAFEGIDLHFNLDENANEYWGDREKDRIDGKVHFTGPIEIPVLFERKPEGGWTLWMSHTPNEVLSQIGHIAHAKHRAARAKAEGGSIHVVIGGLGIGWILTKVAALPGVGRITVIERNQALADFILPRLCGHLPKKVKVDVRIGDLFESTAGLEGADLMLVDIWPKYGDVTQDHDRLRDLGMNMPIEVWGWLE
jgi:hypothetical protein